MTCLLGQSHSWFLSHCHLFFFLRSANESVLISETLHSISQCRKVLLGSLLSWMATAPSILVSSRQRAKNFWIFASDSHPLEKSGETSTYHSFREKSWLTSEPSSSMYAQKPHMHINFTRHFYKITYISILNLITKCRHINIKIALLHSKVLILSMSWNLVNWYIDVFYWYVLSNKHK